MEIGDSGIQAPPNYGQPVPLRRSPAPNPGVVVNENQRELDELEEKGTLWLLAAGAGFFLGLGLVTGPLAWYYGGKLCGRYRALGLRPRPSANWAWALGLISTVVYVMSTITLIALAVLLVGGLTL